MNTTDNNGMNLNNPPGKFIMTVMVILGLASCKKPIYYTISASVQPAGSGSIVVTPYAESVLEGTTVTFKATSIGDYLFTGWSGSLSGTTNPATIVATSDLNVIANFKLKTYPLSISVKGEGTVNERIVSTKTDYDSGTLVELTATPDTYWVFDHWEGSIDGSENPIKLTITTETEVTAVFVEHDPGIVFTEVEYISPFEINRRMGMGWNVACQLDAYREDGEHVVVDEEAWGNPKCTQILFDKAAAAGFKSVRIPVTWLGTFGPAPEYKIDEQRLERVAEVVGYAEKAGMYAIINMQHDGAAPHQEGHRHYEEFWINPAKAAADPAYNAKVKEQLTAMWTQIARKFRDKGDFLLFESFNEPGSDFFWSWANSAEKDAHQGEYDCLSEWNQTFVDAVRATGGNNAKRWLVIVGAAAKERNLDRLKIPTDYVSNNRLMLAIHVYEPEEYAFGQCEEWGHTAQIADETIWRFDERFLAEEFKRYKEQYMDKGIPLCIDEIGCFNRETERGKAFQLYYLEYLARAAKLNGFATYIWDDGGREGVKRGEFLFWHGTGEYFDYAEEVVATVKKAMYSEDPSYTLESIYNSAPFSDPSAKEAIGIPDPEFKRYLIGKYDINGDGEINKDETWRITEIDIDTKNVKSLEGLTQFANLQVLRCRGREDWVADVYGPGLLTELDVTKNPLLRNLEINNNHITSLDLSNNHELENLCIRSNELSWLDLSGCPNLRWFDASINKLSAIDFSHNPKLQGIYLRGNNICTLSVVNLTSLDALNFGGNNIGSIDLSNNPKIQNLEVDGNRLDQLDISYLTHLNLLRCNGNPGLKTVWIGESTTIDQLYKDDFTELVTVSTRDYPDPVFRKYIMTNFDLDHDNLISSAEAEKVKTITINTDNITSLKGISNFVYLEELDCQGSYEEEYGPKGHHGVLADLDISGNKELVILKCGYNQLPSLDVSGNPKLKVLYCQNNLISKLDVSQNQLLEDLCFRYCHVTSLDVSNNPNLHGIDCQGGPEYNQIESIDVSGCPSLSLFNCNSVGLSSIDVSHNPSLDWLGIVDSTVTSIDLSHNPHLGTLYANRNKLKELDLTNNTEIKWLYVLESSALETVYLKSGHVIEHLYKDDHTQIVYK